MQDHSAEVHRYPKKRRSNKLRYPKYEPTHNEAFRDRLAMDREDWRVVFAFMANRRQLALVDLKSSLRAKLTADMPELIAYADHRCLDPRLLNRAHTVLDLSATSAKTDRWPKLRGAPAAALDSLEDLLRRSIEERAE